MRVACIQADLGSLDADARIATMVDRVASLRDVDLVVLPELWHVGYFAFDRYADEAQTLDGPVVGALREVAIASGIFVHAGSIVERSDDGRLYNTSVLLSPEGRVLHTYRKVHLFGYQSEESSRLTAGDDVSGVDTDLGRLAMTTCYDLRFPELFRKLADDGVEVVLVASAWPAERIGHWDVLTRARALDNLMYLVACNAAGTDNGVTLGGSSTVVDPWGDVVARAGNDDDVLVGSVDVPRVAKLREEFPVLDDRRLHVIGP